MIKTNKTQGNNPMIINLNLDEVIGAVTSAAHACIDLITHRQLNETMQAQTAAEAATAIEIVLQLHRLQTKIGRHADSVIMKLRDK
jgi:hypothetical protein